MLQNCWFSILPVISKSLKVNYLIPTAFYLSEEHTYNACDTSIIYYKWKYMCNGSSEQG